MLTRVSAQSVQQLLMFIAQLQVLVLPCVQGL